MMMHFFTLQAPALHHSCKNSFSGDFKVMAVPLSSVSHQPVCFLRWTSWRKKQHLCHGIVESTKAMLVVGCCWCGTMWNGKGQEQSNVAYCFSLVVVPIHIQTKAVTVCASNHVHCWKVSKCVGVGAKCEHCAKWYCEWAMNLAMMSLFQCERTGWGQGSWHHWWWVWSEYQCPGFESCWCEFLTKLHWVDFCIQTPMSNKTLHWIGPLTSPIRARPLKELVLVGMWLRGHLTWARSLPVRIRR